MISIKSETTSPFDKSQTHFQLTIGGLLLIFSNQFIKCKVHGKWGPWGPWKKCSKKCRVGRQHRYRACNKPKPKYGGRRCRGPKRQTRACNKNVPCAGKNIVFKFY